MSKKQLCNRRMMSLVCAFLIFVMLLVGCRKKQTLPQPSFPLSEEALTAALEDAGLSWSVEQSDESLVSTTTRIIFTLHQPVGESAYNTIFVDSHHTDELGRMLQMTLREPKRDLWWEREAVGWEDWQGLLTLAARLYGGFEHADEIYRACSNAELPQEETTLWQGALTGGYCVIRVNEPIHSWRPPMGYTLSVSIYESEDVYLKIVADTKKPEKNL